MEANLDQSSCWFHSNWEVVDAKGFSIHHRLNQLVFGCLPALKTMLVCHLSQDGGQVPSSWIHSDQQCCPWWAAVVRQAHKPIRWPIFTQNCYVGPHFWLAWCNCWLCGCMPTRNGFLVPEFNLGLQALVPIHSDPLNIFYYEDLVVTCCMLQAISHFPHCLIIYTDNHNIVDIWHSLKASVPYNNLLIITIDALLEHKIDTCILHIPGDNNIIADALLRLNNALVLWLVPQFHITVFTPPQGTLGAAQKWSSCQLHPGNLSERPGPWNIWRPNLPSTSVWLLTVPPICLTLPPSTHTLPFATYMDLILSPFHKCLCYTSLSNLPTSTSIPNLLTLISLVFATKLKHIFPTFVTPARACLYPVHCREPSGDLACLPTANSL